MILRGPGCGAGAGNAGPRRYRRLAEGAQRYGLFTNESGGVLDDLMIANKGDHLLPGRERRLRRSGHRPSAPAEAKGISVQPVTDRALLALQGPRAEAVLGVLVPGVAAMKFMDVAEFDWNGATLCGSAARAIPARTAMRSRSRARAVALAEALLASRGRPDRSGARDSLRLEAGMPLYGHDMDADTARPRRR